ncbi:MAG TPA: hypothetical protein VJT73_08350 [Polyangiaceae bacterium]|nr:hypothetical protein [Polyangiaceae bacterium]
MSAQSESTTSAQSGPRIGRSVLAVFLGMLAGAALSLGTDQVLHVLDVYPPWGQPMRDPRLNLLALSYRCVYDIAGCYIIAKLAPKNPMRHALIGGSVGFVLSMGGVVAGTMADLGPLWYPVLLALTTLPCAWIAGVLHRKWERAV